MAKVKQGFPLWASNLLVFGLLIVVVVAYFIWQVQQNKKVFIKDAKAHAKVVANVIQVTRGYYSPQVQLENMLSDALLVTASNFVEYLDSVEPLEPEELNAIVEKTGLDGIKIIRNGGMSVAAPSHWSPDLGCEEASLRVQETVLEKKGGKNYVKEQLLFCWPTKKPGYVVLGLSSDEEKVCSDCAPKNFPVLLSESLPDIPEILYVRFENLKTTDNSTETEPLVTILEQSDKLIAQVQLQLEDRTLILGLDAEDLELSLKLLWRNFFISSTALTLLGALLSFLLFRRQTFHLAQVRAFEKQLSKEREDGVLGRAAVSIAHEVRNPLNALNMGLQRLQLEGKEILPEHQRLVNHMLDAVRRTNGIVKGLLNYARPQAPRKQTMHLYQLVENMVDLYQPSCVENNIRVVKNLHFRGPISADPDLLGQVLENLLRNAIEAQPKSGFINLGVARKGHEIVLTIQNGGFSLPPEQAEQIFEPYFTTKTEGTGLGLSIARRIVQAHKGRMEVRCPKDDTLEIAIYLPL
jgi:signal transduction histidine kinase